MVSAGGWNDCSLSIAYWTFASGHLLNLLLLGVIKLCGVHVMIFVQNFCNVVVTCEVPEGCCWKSSNLFFPDRSCVYFNDSNKNSETEAVKCNHNDVIQFT